MDWNDLLTGSLQQALGPTAAVYCLAAIGLNIHFGYTGLLNFGQAGFMMVAGYSMVTMSTVWGLSLWLGVLLGLGLTIVFALLLGVPTLRLRADYLAIVTIAAAEIVRQVISAARFSDDLGGQDGLTGFIRPFREVNPFSEPVGIEGVVRWSANDFWVMTVGWALVALCVPGRLAADAQPLGSGAEVDPRGRGRRPLARQERLLLQDAVADHRRHVRRAGRLRGRAAVGHRRAVLLRHGRDLLRLHGAADRRRGAGASAPWRVR